VASSFFVHTKGTYELCKGRPYLIDWVGYSEETLQCEEDTSPMGGTSPCRSARQFDTALANRRPNDSLGDSQDMPKMQELGAIFPSLLA
jgi:hypothetical protein